MIVVLGGLRCGGFLLLGTLLLACERSLVLVRSRRVLDCRCQNIQLLGRQFQGGWFRLLRSCRERSSRHLEFQLSREQVLVNLP